MKIYKWLKYNKVNVKLSGLQLYELKCSVTNQAEITLRMSRKMFNGNNLPYGLLLTTR